MSSRSIAIIVLRVVGALVTTLGIVHLVATPHITALIRGSPPEVYAWAVGPTLLNHVLVGILLLPLGYTTWLAAGASNKRWARLVLVVNTLAILSLPVALVAFVRQPLYYRAPWFLSAVALVAAISALTLVATALLVFRAFAPQRHTRLSS